MGLRHRAAEYGKAISSEANTVNATVAESLTVPTGAVSALVTCDAATRYRVDGTSPTATVGHYVAAYGNVELFLDDMDEAEFISVSGDSVLFITYFGE